MKLTEMIELANNGIKAKDVLTLHKQGFTKDIILELSEEPSKDPDEPKEPDEPKTEQAAPKEAEKEEDSPDDSQSNPALAEIDKLKAQLEKEKQRVLELQKANRNKDFSDKQEEDPLKHIHEVISSVM